MHDLQIAVVGLFGGSLATLLMMCKAHSVTITHAENSENNGSYVKLRPWAAKTVAFLDACAWRVMEALRLDD